MGLTESVNIPALSVPPPPHMTSLPWLTLQRLFLLGGTWPGCQGSTVDALVLEEVLLLTEAAATGSTQVGPLPRVVALVPREVGFLAEAAAALWAGVGPLTCVDALVDVQR